MREISIATFLQIQSDIYRTKNLCWWFLMVLFYLFVRYSLLLRFHVLLFPLYLGSWRKGVCEKHMATNHPPHLIYLNWHYQICIVRCISIYSFFYRDYCLKIRAKPLPKINLEKVYFWLPSVAQKHLCLSSLMWKELLKKKEKLMMNDNNNNNNNNNFQYMILHSLNVHSMKWACQSNWS